MRGMSFMWLLVIVVIFQLSSAHASSPVPLELLFDNKLKKFIASEPTVSKTTHSDDRVASSFRDEKDPHETEDMWQEFSDD